MYREEQLKSLLEGRRILIAGYGREGQSAERLVRRLVPDATCSVAVRVENGKWQTASGEWHDDWPFDMVVKSPGIPTWHLSSCPGQLTSLTDLFLQVYGDITIGVTGTKGKSTTASLIHHLLPGSLLAGNIGVPLFDILDQLDEQSVVVAELSCHQLEVLHRSPHVAVLLNLYQEHLDHYEDYMGYKMAKMQIGLHQQAGDHLFWCADAAELAALVQKLPMPGIQHPYSLDAVSGEERALLESCPLQGSHNRSNALVACRVAQVVTRRPLSVFRSALSTFQGLRHRLERVGEYRGVTWYDDSISTVPEAAMAAVRALGRVDTLILGGFDRGIDYTPLVRFLASEHPVPNIAFVGAAGRRMKELLAKEMPLCSDAGSDTQAPGLRSSIVEDDYAKIVPWCASVTPRGGTVLLSPAAASYDAFKNFEHRGDFYREQIMKL